MTLKNNFISDLIPIIYLSIVFLNFCIEDKISLHKYAEVDLIGFKYFALYFYLPYTIATLACSYFILMPLILKYNSSEKINKIIWTTTLCFLVTIFVLMIFIKVCFADGRFDKEDFISIGALPFFLSMPVQIVMYWMWYFRNPRKEIGLNGLISILFLIFLLLLPWGRHII